MRTDPPEARRWIGPALALTLAVTAARIVVLWFDNKQLFVDEAQYWLWGQDLAWGYFSKPPLVGWVIRAATEFAGSDAPFFVRLPAPLLHGATAMLIGGLAASLGGAALWSVAIYLSLPLVAVGSLLMTTDTVMFPFLAGGLWAWVTASRRRSAGWGAFAGAAVGVAFLAKYSALYYPGAAALAALVVPVFRPGWAAALAGAAALLVVVSPNLAWNASHGLITLQHTMDNVDWARDPAARVSLNLDELGEFVGAQFVVFGPVFLSVLAALGVRWRRQPHSIRLLLVFSLPLIALFVAQAAVSRAYANWAAPAYLAGTVAVAAALAVSRRGWLAGGLALNAALSVAVAAAVVIPPDRLPDPVRAAAMDRYLGRVELSQAIVAQARQAGAATVVSDDRDVLADLFYNGRDSGLVFRAVPPEGRPPHHYALSFAFEGGPDDVLYVGRPGRPPACLGEAEPAGATLAPSPGYWASRPRAAWIVPGDCWTP